ncbi:hypothetical protein C8R46DRAFT_1222237 [Mycena filopes]|nr:hypothetical protein C8R46DRAFT_1222237 [Mycena filopes]
MALLPLRFRRSLSNSLHKSWLPLSRTSFPLHGHTLPTGISRPALLLLLTFALSLLSLLLALARYSSFSPSSRIAFALDVWHTPTYDPFTRPPAADAIADPTVRAIQAHERIPDRCLDEWISGGRWRGACVRVPVEESPIDLVYIWVNGSDVYHAESRAALLASLNYTTRNARFRQHDELRFSLRSAFANTKLWTQKSVWHIVTADVPDPDSAFDGDDGAQRLGLVPQWLDVESAWAGGENGEPPVYLYHDSQLFRYTSPPGHTPSIEEVERWRDAVLPTFNSMAVESQLPHLDPEVVSENIIYLNDDQFLTLPLPPSAFHSPLYGPVFRLYPGFMIQGGPVGGRARCRRGRVAELGVERAYLRFGTRSRAYIGHNARSLSLPLLHEAALTFGPAFAATPKSQFRGSHDVAGEYEVNTVFVGTHFVMEREREALLWAWVVAKWGSEEGVLDEALKAAMWLELGAEDDEGELRRNSTGRTSNGDVRLNMRAAGLEVPGSEVPEERANTTYLFVSLDGYTPNHTDRPGDFVLSRDECIGRGRETAWAVFRRLAVEKTHCGDAVITALTNTAPRGLAIFLPPPTSSPPPPTTDLAILPLLLPLTPPPLPSNPRAFALRLIQRYSYAIAETPSAFFGVENAELGRVYFSWLHADTALLCVNDDLDDGALNLTRGDRMMRGAFGGMWPERLGYEKEGVKR